jgi:hypothetical protein
MAGNVLSDEAVAQIRRLMRDFYAERQQGQVRPGGRGSQRNVMALLDEDLFAADNQISEPATAQASVQGIDVDDDLYDTGQTITVVNRFENIAVPADTLIKCEWINGEWQPYAADCPNFSSSSLAANSGLVSSTGGVDP